MPVEQNPLVGAKYIILMDVVDRLEKIESVIAAQAVLAGTPTSLDALRRGYERALDRQMPVEEFARMVIILWENDKSG